MSELCDSLDLLRYLDQDLEPAEMAVARQHLSGCQLCRTALSDLRDTIRQLKPVWTLGRRLCPSGDQLAALVFDPPGEEVVQQHTARCVMCKQEVSLMEDLSTVSTRSEQPGALPAVLAAAVAKRKRHFQTNKLASLLRNVDPSRIVDLVDSLTHPPRDPTPAQAMPASELEGEVDPHKNKQGHD